jgi:hypothetical protein
MEEGFVIQELISKKLKYTPKTAGLSGFHKNIG